MAYVSESLLYICFSIVMGHFLLQLIPEKYRPQIAVPKALIIASVIAIPILSYVPIHVIVLQYMDSFKLGYVPMVRSILLDLPIGEAWLWTLLGSAGLSVMVSVPAFTRDKHMPKVAFILMLLLTFWLGFASHSASISSFRGLFIHTTHFTVVSLWLGVLFLVSWFVKDYDEKWEKLLRWFSPFAIGCVIIALLTGITLMTFTTEQYNNGLMLSYGQYLLLKHISIIPLLWLAYSNGFLYTKRLKSEATYSPKSMLRAESFAALLVLVFTALMGQQAPSHNVIETLRTESPSGLFTSIFQGAFSPDLQLYWHFNINSVLLWIAAIIMLYVIYVAGKLQKFITMSLVTILFILFAYLGYMFGITSSTAV